MISKVETGIEEGGGRQENRDSSLALIIRETSLTLGHLNAENSYPE